MSRFSIWIVQPDRYPHTRMFVDHASSLAWALRQLGHEVDFNPGRGDYVENPSPISGGRMILFGAQLLPDMPLPHDAILYNTEQVQMDEAPGQMWLTGSLLKYLKRHMVWDYSADNIARLKVLGVERLAHCRVGYAPHLARIAPAAEDVDVLFVGTQTPRRVAILEAVAEATLSDGRKPVVKSLYGVYGDELDRWVARAKVVVNVHYYDPVDAVFEIFRCSHLWANRKCVVTEDGERDQDLEALASRCALRVPYDGIAGGVIALLDDKAAMEMFGQPAAAARKVIAEAAFKEFSAVDQVAEVKRALEQSGIA